VLPRVQRGEFDALRSRLDSGKSLAVHRQLDEQRCGGVDDCPGRCDGLDPFGESDVIAGLAGVFNLGARAAQRAERLERPAELRAYDLLGGDVVTGSPSAQALLGEECGARFAGGVVGQDVRGLGVGGRFTLG